MTTCPRRPLARRAAATTRRRSPTSVRMPHPRAKATEASGIIRKCVGDAAVLQPAEVVVEDLLRRGLAGLEPVEHRLVLEQVLAPLDRPHLPARGLGRQIPRQRREVGGGGRRPGVHHQDVARASRPDLEDADLVVLGRRARRT